MKRMIRAATESIELQDAKESTLSTAQNVIDEELDKLVETCKAQEITVKFLQDIPDIKSSCMRIVTELIDKYSKKLAKLSQSAQEYEMSVLSRKMYIASDPGAGDPKFYKPFVAFAYNKYELNINIDMRGVFGADVQYYYTVWDADDGLVQIKIRTADYYSGRSTVFSTR